MPTRPADLTVMPRAILPAPQPTLQCPSGAGCGARAHAGSSKFPTPTQCQPRSRRRPSCQRADRRRVVAAPAALARPATRPPRRGAMDDQWTPPPHQVPTPPVAPSTASAQPHHPAVAAIPPPLPHPTPAVGPKGPTPYHAGRQLVAPAAPICRARRGGAVREAACGGAQGPPLPGGRGGGGSARHIVTPRFGPGRDTRATLQAVAKGWPSVSAASASSSRPPPAAPRSSVGGT